LKLGEQNEIADFINEYINNKNKNAIDSSSFRYYLLMDTCICCSEFLTSIGISKDDLEKLSIAGAQAVTFDKFIDSFDDIIRQSLKLRDSISWGKHKEIIEKTKDFMQKNYNNKEISLNYVSDEMGISSTYLSTIFSTETNETFIEYLTKLRMEKAKDLLLTTELRSSEIAFYIGYQDAHYFSYLFKKYTKMSPRDFKRRSN
jgi:two-component system response regulator YesN